MNFLREKTPVIANLNLIFQEWLFIQTFQVEKRFNKIYRQKNCIKIKWLKSWKKLLHSIYPQILTD